MIQDQSAIRSRARFEVEPSIAGSSQSGAARAFTSPRSRGLVTGQAPAPPDHAPRFATWESTSSSERSGERDALRQTRCATRKRHPGVCPPLCSAINGSAFCLT